MGANMENASKLATAETSSAACVLKTPEFAKLNGVKPNTVRQHLCNRGSYYGVKPEKRANGRNYWPAIVPTQSA
jgi:hypothetical protein